jgi:rod shape-determining protein MreC
VVARSGPRNTRLLVVGLVAASLAIITLDFREGDAGPLASMGRAAQAFMAPLQEGVTRATRPVGDFLTGIAHLPSLSRENQELRDQLAQYAAGYAAYVATKERLAQVSDQTGLRDAYKGSVAATVIAKGLSNYEYTVTIDQGSNAGVEQDDPVITGGPDSPLLVGIVSSVTAVSADVRLLIDRDFAVAGKLATSGETGLVVGQGDQDMQMEQIPAGTKIPNRDQPEYVFTTTYHIGDEHGRYPPDLLIGQVSSFYDNTTPLENVTVKPAVDFSSLEYVLVLQSQSGGKA